MSQRFGAKTTADEVLRGVDLSGRNMLITGANAGIGRETASALAAAGAHVLAACRTAANAEAVRAHITGLYPQAKVTPLVVDLSSFASVRRCAERVPRVPLHALICNAGLFASRYEATEDGLERTVGVCHFGHALLVRLLFDRLRDAAPARVVMVSSESHRHPRRLDFERFPLSRERYRALVAYGQAKLCNVLFANQLTRLHAAEGVFANALHPGSLIGTSIFRDSISAKLLSYAARPFAKSIAQGAATTVFCASAPELDGVGARYYADCSEKLASAGARDATAAERLWDLTCARIAGSEPAAARPVALS